MMIVRFGDDGHRWLASLTADHVKYSLAQAMWRRGRDGDPPEQLVAMHAGFVSEKVSIALVTDLTGDTCDFARSDHTCCTRMVNKIHGRPRGTIWDNRGLLTYEVVGWEGALDAIGRIAALAAIENGTNDPYKSDKFFGPELWGKSELCARPAEALSDRTTMPTEATFALFEPEVRPMNLTRAELIHEAEAAIDAGIARAVAELDDPPKLRHIRPFHGRKHCDGPVALADIAGFIGPVDLVEAAKQEADSWQSHYQRCRHEFPEHQDVAFPAGTIRFRRLGAVCDPFQPHRRPRCPPGSEPYRPVPPVYPEPARTEFPSEKTPYGGRAPPR